MARSPGVVLRVSTMVARVWRTESTIARVCVAMPLMRPMKLSAVRSAVSRPRAGPFNVPTTSPGATALPSGFSTSSAIAGSTSAKAS